MSVTSQPNTVNGCGRSSSTRVTRSITGPARSTHANGDVSTSVSPRTSTKKARDRSRSDEGRNAIGTTDPSMATSASVGSDRG